MPETQRLNQRHLVLMMLHNEPTHFFIGLLRLKMIFLNFFDFQPKNILELFLN